MTTMAPEVVDESLDPRDPLLRLSTFFDDGSVELLHERDKSGVLAAAGTVNGVRTVALQKAAIRLWRSLSVRRLRPTLRRDFSSFSAM